jgi:hypothetical protein
VRDPTFAGRTHTRTGSPSLPSRPVSDGAARILLASPPNQERARCDRPTNATRTKTSTRTSLVPGVSTALRRGDCSLGSGLRALLSNCFETGDTGGFTSSGSRFGGSPSCGRGLSLPELREATEPLTLLSRTASLLPRPFGRGENTLAMRLGRLVRPPRDREAIRDDPECLPPSGTLRSDRPASFDGRTGHLDPRGTLSRLREPRTTLSRHPGPSPDPRALCWRRVPDHDRLFASHPRQPANRLPRASR